MTKTIKTKVFSNSGKTAQTMEWPLEEVRGNSYIFTKDKSAISVPEKLEV